MELNEYRSEKARKDFEEDVREQLKQDLGELTPEQFEAVRKFANDLKGCFQAKLLNVNNELQKIILNYASTIIDIHLDLAEISFTAYGLRLEREKNS